MPVKQIGMQRGGKTATKKAATKPATQRIGAKAATDEVVGYDISKLKLPTERKKPVTDFHKYSVLLYGEPKCGKTTLGASLPDACFLSPESGTTGLEIFEFNSENGGVNSWQEYLQAVKLFEKTKRFTDIVTDTLDEAFQQCTDYMCKRLGIEHPHDADDYGKTWNKVTREFLGALNRIKHTGRGIYLLSHASERTIETVSGKKFMKIGPSLSGKSGLAIQSWVDMIWFMFRGRNRRRLILTEGDDMITAGSRKRGFNNPMPPAILLPEDETRDYEHIAAVFRGDEQGAIPEDIWAPITASKTVEKAVTAARTRTAKKGGADA